jgi:hypothetical protein
MSSDDILNNGSLVAIVAGVIGLFILFGGGFAWLGIIFLGLIAVFFGITNFLRDRNDILAILATIIGIAVIAAALYWHFIH